MMRSFCGQQEEQIPEGVKLHRHSHIGSQYYTQLLRNTGAKPLNGVVCYSNGACLAQRLNTNELVVVIKRAMDTIVGQIGFQDHNWKPY